MPSTIIINENFVMQRTILFINICSMPCKVLYIDGCIMLSLFCVLKIAYFNVLCCKLKIVNLMHYPINFRMYMLCTIFVLKFVQYSALSYVWRLRILGSFVVHPKREMRLG